MPIVGLFLSGLLLVAGCAGSGASGSPELVDGVVVEVDALDNTFRADEITVAPGTEVAWTNKGRNEHNILPVDDGEFRVDAAQFGPDATYRYRFTEPGTYAYYCSLHGTSTKGMIGTVIVGSG
jgi:plastocyanin